MEDRLRLGTHIRLLWYFELLSEKCFRHEPWLKITLEPYDVRRQCIPR
jgi:hypothetical protein